MMGGADRRRVEAAFIFHGVIYSALFTLFLYAACTTLLGVGGEASAEAPPWLEEVITVAALVGGMMEFVPFITAPRGTSEAEAERVAELILVNWLSRGFPLFGSAIAAALFKDPLTTFLTLYFFMALTALPFIISCGFLMATIPRRRLHYLFVLHPLFALIPLLAMRPDLYLQCVATGSLDPFLILLPIGGVGLLGLDGFFFTCLGLRGPTALRR